MSETFIKVDSCHKCAFFKEDNYGNYICNYGKNRKITRTGECLNFKQNPLLRFSSSTEVEY